MPRGPLFDPTLQGPLIGQPYVFRTPEDEARVAAGKRLDRLRADPQARAELARQALEQTSSGQPRAPAEEEPERLALLPRYSEEEGLVAPELVAGIVRALSLPGRAIRGDDVSADDPANFALNVAGGSLLARRPKGSVGMGGRVAEPSQLGAPEGMEAYRGYGPNGKPTTLYRPKGEGQRVREENAAQARGEEARRFADVEADRARIARDYADDPATAKALKSGDPAAVERAALEMAGLVDEGATLVPVPGSSGDLSANTALAQAIAQRTGATVAPALRGAARESNYARKKAGLGPLGGAALRMSRAEEVALPEGAPVYLVDNVTHSGNTMRAAREALGGGTPLAYARSTEPVTTPYATRYPEVGEPVLRSDPKTGREYLGKGQSAEEAAVQEQRQAAQKDIRAGNYSPYFPVEERFNVDPGNYPLEGNTLTDALPKKAATIEKYRAMFNTPEARRTLTAAFKKGNADPNARDWYAMGQLEKVFVDELGEEAGRAGFKEWADAMAATTGGADPTSNLMMAHYGNFLRARGDSPPGNSYGMPFPIGGRYVTGNMEMYDKVLNQGRNLTAADQPKRHNFSANFQGHADRATLDEQMSGGFQEGLAAPPGQSYGVMEKILDELAKRQGVSPMNFQDVTWAGLKGTEGKPMIQHVNEAIERTSRITGLTPEQVVKQNLIRKLGPLFSVGPAAVGVGAAATGDRDRR